MSAAPIKDGMAEVRAQLEKMRKPVPPAFRPPHADMFRKDLEINAFDPSLRHTGWVHFCWYSKFGLIVHGHKTINLTTQLKGYMGVWDLARQLDFQITDLMAWSIGAGEQIVVEAPPVGNDALNRTDSPLAAGSVIYRNAIESHYPFEAVQLQHASKILTGSRAHDKKAIAEAVAIYIPESTGHTWSEHQRDAAAIALTFLYDCGPREPE